MNAVKTYHNILIVRTDRIGDVVLTTPAIKALRQAYPSSRISILVTPATFDLVSGNPYLDEIIVDDRSGKNKGALGFLRLVQEIKLKKFDLVIIYHTKRRYNLACFCARIPNRLGFKNDKFGFLLTQPLKDERCTGQKHEAEYCLDVLKSIGVKDEDLDVFVPLQKTAEEWAVLWLKENGLKPNDFILIHPGASDPQKCWPAGNFAQLINCLVEKYPYRIVLIGAQQTAHIADEILRQTPKASGILSLIGKTSLAQLMSLLRRSRLLISNDSGPVHVASGVGTSVISLFTRNQPGINPERWRPLGSNSFILRSDSLKVADVFGVAEQVLQKDTQYEIF